ncbi:hypothetical protein KKC1_24240 [Calderihabitans maritimus]|uniref:Uncharacterized protein n=1 Tax=Calderihabitans maritimus TaxID=1246530 RepID=A0A1Z5HVB6_9FIRM|nr:hypothetical protein KKC1_24240 [Calderihabitans maritimus]
MKFVSAPFWGALLIFQAGDGSELEWGGLATGRLFFVHRLSEGRHSVQVIR